jgi:hypothetical protein
MSQNVGMQAHYILTTLHSAFSGMAISKKTDRQKLMTNCTAIREKKSAYIRITK